MADKPPAKGPPKPKEKPPVDVHEEIIFLLIALMVFMTIVGRLAYLSFSNGPLAALMEFLRIHVLPWVHLTALFLSILFAVGIVWVLLKSRALHSMIATENEAVPEVAVPGAPEPNRKWQRVLNHLNSQSENDWKFAILEADIMLSDLLDSLNYPGATMGDKLKVANPNDFKTIEAAWEAHKIRNTIAHEGANYTLSEREARRVIDLYASVFQEHRVI